MPAIWLFAILAGMFWAALPALFKSRFNVNEILSSLMLNYIAFLLLAYLVQGIFKDPEGFNFPESKLFHSAALLPVILEGTRLHLGVLITPLLLFGMWLLLQRTLLGFQVQVLGYSHNAAAYSGVSQKKLLWISMLLGGGFAGLAGMMEVNGAVGTNQCYLYYRLWLYCNYCRFFGQATPCRNFFCRHSYGRLLPRRRNCSD